jgi:hypothetical protein
MRLRLQRDRLRSLTISFVSRFLAVFIISSFAVTLLPIVSSSAESSMPCCAGKSSEHCDSGLAKPKPAPVVTEPMCGAEKPVAHASAVTKSHNPPLLKAETTSRSVVVAESNNSLTSAESISQPCRMDCGACATLAARQLKRQKSAVPARVASAALSATTTSIDTETPFVLSTEFWTRINPRGPPSELL